MVSTAYSIPGNDKPADRVRDLLASMQEFTEASDWQRLLVVVGKLQPLIEQVPPADRRELSLEANRCIDKTRQAANYARNEICDKLVSLRQGRKAAASYQEAAGALR